MNYTTNEIRLMDLLIVLPLTTEECVGIAALAKTEECRVELIKALEKISAYKMDSQQIMNICGQVIKEHQ